MKIIPIFIFILFILPTKAQVLFSDYFTGERLRYDYIIAGNYEYTKVYDHQFVYEPQWGGSVKNLIDTFRYGELLIEVLDSVSSNIIYSKGYSSLFKEWQSVKEAKARERAFIESLVIPFPKKTIKLMVYERDSLSHFIPVHNTYFNPNSFLVQHANLCVGIKKYELMISGNPSNKIDMAIISEGYTAAEEDTFLHAAKKYMEYFFTWEPYKAYRNKFNFYAIFAPSPDSGTDIPGDTIWAHTALNTNFYTFGSERYLTTSNIMRLREVAMEIPYDQLCILVNTNKYGGGGIYNCFTVFSSGSQYSGFLFLHEFGHAFAGLADEYYTSPTAYDDIIVTNIEPYQPNITTLVNFETKWNDMVQDTVPIPTPNCKTYAGVIGVFEGAAYQAKGIYRPAYDCAMKSKTSHKFCPVCKRAIERMILFYCDE